MDRVGTRRHTKPRYLSAPAKAWLGFVAVAASLDGLVWVVIPSTAHSNAYRMVTDIAPQAVWGWSMTLAGTLAWFAVMFDGRRWAADCGRLALAVYMIVCFVVGLSIFRLTLAGAESALTGAGKWWGVSFVCGIVLAGPTMTTSREVSLVDWVTNRGEWMIRS